MKKYEGGNENGHLGSFFIRHCPGKKVALAWDLHAYFSHHQQPGQNKGKSSSSVQCSLLYTWYSFATAIFCPSVVLIKLRWSRPTHCITLCLDFTHRLERLLHSVSMTPMHRAGNAIPSHTERARTYLRRVFCLLFFPLQMKIFPLVCSRHISSERHRNFCSPLVTRS